jgi:hypothetical protein
VGEDGARVQISSISLIYLYNALGQELRGRAL